MKFVHLHVHSHYSLLDGLSRLDDIVKFAKEDGSNAIALTDHGVMYGIINFYKKCKKAGVKCIIGNEIYTTTGSRFDREVRRGVKNANHLILLAKNQIGYKNLLKITSIANLEGFYYKPRVDWEILKQYHEGLIATSACLGGEIPQLILTDQFDAAKKRIMEYAELFGKDNYYLELQHHPEIEGQDKVNKKLIEYSKELGVPLVATNDAHYVNREDAEAQDILLCLQNKAKKADTNRMTMINYDLSLRSSEEMCELFKHVPSAIENTVKIAEMCDVEIELGNIQLPFYKVPEGYDEASYFIKLCKDGMQDRYGKTYDEVDAVYRERLDYELKVILDMGWPSYFLIVADFVVWAKKQNIMVGPGRGSAAGSIVSYLTGITNLCPIKYELLFERFLNPERVSMPDIDLDFADTRRGEVIKYVQEVYGEDHVAQIITFGTMAARASVRDVGRVLDFPYDYCDKISKSIPMFTKLSEALDTVPEFQALYQEADAKQIIDYALKLEGVSRHASTHACGVLITKEPLTETVPTQYASSSDNSIVSQYSLHPVEDLGLLKMDFLGLKNLSIIEGAVKRAKMTRGIEIDMDNIPLDDEKAYKLFQNGDTTGVFQFESGGMKRYLKELKATEFEDIIAMVALYRPGPMEWIPDYIAGKHGKKVEYLHPKLEPLLKKTYGVAIYQEQVMQMARDLAGFTLGGADVLRKAMGKKIVSLLEAQKVKFLDGCVANDIDRKLAENIFSFIEPFAGYGFNRSHAACYALVAYMTAYLKANWPAEFMAALLTADEQDTERVAIEIEECRNMGIEVKQPNINQSFESFTVVTSGTETGEQAKPDEEVNTIRFGLNAIKNVGSHIANVIIEERKRNGRYEDLRDFLERIDDKDLNKKSLESLIKAGAFDEFNERGEMLHNLESMLSYHKQMAYEKNNNQISLFANSADADSIIKLNLMPTEPISNWKKLAFERELLGLYISDHPFNDFKKRLSNVVVPLAYLKEQKNETLVKISGVIISIKKILTRKNDNMLFVKIEDGVNNVEVLVFPKVLDRTLDIWEEGTVVICEGTISDKDGDIKILANKAGKLRIDNFGQDLDDFQKIQVVAKKSWNKGGFGQSAPPPPKVAYPPLKIIVKQEDLSENVVATLKAIFENNKGASKVYMKIMNGEGFKVIEGTSKVCNDYSLGEDIKSQLPGIINIV